MPVLFVKKPLCTGDLSGTVRIVYSGIFRDIQGHSVIFSHVQAYRRTLRHIEVYSGIIGVVESQSDIFGTLHNPCIYIQLCHFRTLAYLEPDAYSKDDHAHSEPRNSRNSLFRHIQGYSATLSCAQLGRRGEVAPALFENPKKCPDCICNFKNLVLRVSRRKKSKSFPMEPLFLAFFLCLPQLFSAPALRHYFFCKTSHLKCLTVF